MAYYFDYFGTNGNLDDLANWSQPDPHGIRLPGASDNAVLEGSGTLFGNIDVYSVSIYVSFTFESGTITAANTIYDPASDFTVDGASVVTSGYFTLGDYGAASSTIEAGGHLVTGGVTLGNQAGSSGTLTVTGTGTTLADTSSTVNIFVGWGGQGYLTVSDGGLVNTNSLGIGGLAGSEGTVLITGAGTELDTNSGKTIIVGQSGTAHLTIEDKATVTTSTLEVANEQGGPEDTLDVDNATLNVDSFITIGPVGTADVTFRNKSAVNTGGVTVGYLDGSDGSLTVTGTGTTLTDKVDTTGITVGYQGSGTLEVDGGAIVNASCLNLGMVAGSEGTVLITGTGTQVTTTNGQYQNILVGQSGTASLTIQDHALVTTTNMEVGAAQGAADDELDVDGATLTVVQTLTIGSGGTATVENGGTISAGKISIASNGILTLSASTLSNTVVYSGGTLEISNGGSATGTIVNSGGYEIVSSGGTTSDTVLSGGQVEILSEGQADEFIAFADALTLSTSGTSILKLDDPTSFDAKIVNWGLGDVVDLVNTSITSAVLSAASPGVDVLDITVSGGAHLCYDVIAASPVSINTGNLALPAVQIKSDGAGGTDLQLEPPPTVLDFLEASQLAYDLPSELLPVSLTLS